MAHDEKNKAPETDPLADAGDVTAAAEATNDALSFAQKEITELKGKLVRWQADFQNLQRRTAREVLEARQNADADFAKDMILILDHFDMALSVDPTKADVKTLMDGVKITRDEFKKLLTNRGIESFDPTGKPFDPHQHEAVMHQPTNEHPPMTVTQSFQHGYKMGERVIRPAKVVVSKGL